ncbi:GNAT family N-acetyltransferase [Neobacillus sp. MM2021_6]|uniref:GNAT family N-acetyltransferase n=1 Tax=Bacillaceae TaxID=186817 RepID=UPI00140CA1F3|nr:MULTISPECIES: GNAT family N-acetyltransferase [Bacillaceae]MBO0960900.1 GNAT family N-acetyltransferase [Neobacillus sp. MM2021_6]NHC21481.1 GNAT family N-acetyltransferase [Bacillus sp. MM2020_4]WML39512.1 GNAT family N-acetyltransferase [Neobacillus sp. OS1-2]
MNVEIRLVNEKEAPIVHKLMLDAFEEYRLLEVPSSALNESLDSLLNVLENGSQNALLCIVNGEPLGSSRFTIKGDSLYFSRLSVTPHARGKGIAKAILLWLEKYANENGKLKMKCRVRASLPKNISLYKAMGYSVSKEEVVINPNGFPVKTVVMEKNLEPNDGQ